MDFLLQEPGEPRLPPGEVRLRKLRLAPFGDSKRIKLFLELSPFQKRPNIEVSIFAASGRQAAHASLLEVTLHKVELTMHLREAIPGSDYRVEICIYYQKFPEPGELGVDVLFPEPLIADRQEVTFTMPLQEALHNR